MSAHPDHQRQGLGSEMLERVCDEMDRLGWPAFVMASPAGVRLYRIRKVRVRGCRQSGNKQGAFTSHVAPISASMGSEYLGGSFLKICLPSSRYWVS